jgi:hypothetical protein
VKFEEAVEIVKRPSREDFERAYGQVWDTEQLREAFAVESFCYGLCFVTRKEDNQRGTLDFNHLPRFYYNFSKTGDSQ